MLFLLYISFIYVWIKICASEEENAADSKKFGFVDKYSGRVLQKDLLLPYLGGVQLNKEEITPNTPIFYLAVQLPPIPQFHAR